MVRGRPRLERPKAVQVQVRFTEDDVNRLDRMVELATERTKGSGAPPPTRASVLRSLFDREVEALGLDKPEKPQTSASKGSATKSPSPRKPTSAPKPSKG